MNSVKDFALGQRVATVDGDGPVVKIGRKYVYVEIEGQDKPGQYLPEDLKVSLTKPVTATEPTTSDPAPATEPVLASVLGELHNAAPVGGRPPMRIKGRRADADHRRAARKAQRKSRRANRTR